MYIYNFEYTKLNLNKSRNYRNVQVEATSKWQNKTLKYLQHMYMGVIKLKKIKYKILRWANDITPKEEITCIKYNHNI